MRWQDHIAVDPHIASGKPTVRGTRLTVEFLLRLLASGWTREQVLHEYPHLPPAGLDAALLFAAEAIAEDRLFPAA